MALFKRDNTNEESKEGTHIPALNVKPAVVDTSVIIDGRIADISKAGFAPGKLLIPRFVLAELQNIADSSDAMRRGRGRRGLEMLNSMREAGVDMDIAEEDFPEIAEVDAKLVRLARTIGANVLTTDYNLNRVASIEGVRVLNINELANAVRPVIIPGEKMMVKIVQAGKERGQGVGYLADGTMIVVDNGDSLIGEEVPAEITRVFQTVAGKMLFAVPVDLKVALETKKAHGSQPKQQSSGRPEKPKHANGGHKPKQQRKPEHSQGNPQQQQADKPNGKKPPQRKKRLSPTQRLENSLMEMTGGNADDPK